MTRNLTKRCGALLLFGSAAFAAAPVAEPTKPVQPAKAVAPAKPLKATHTSGTGPSHARDACTRGESWTFGPAIPSDRQDDFESMLNREMKPVQGFSEGFALRAIGAGTEAKAFGEYWISRALFEGRLFHMAYEGFASIASRAPDETTAGVQLAALECILQIQSKYPAIAFPKSVMDRLQDYRLFTRTPAQKETLYAASGTLIRELITEGSASPQKAEPYFANLVGGGLHEKLARGLWASRKRDHSTTIRDLEAFLAPTASIPALLKRFVDPARILVARAYYTVGRYDAAAAQLRQVTKSSNELANSLQELSWAFLMNDRYSEAIGTAMNLDAGGLRHTYAPEAGMVMAMALNELCQYPESVRAVQLLRKHYEVPYRWLNDWANTSMDGKRRNLYPLAVEFLRKTGKTPERVASEWVRSPLVIASQDEVNLLFDERESQAALARSGVQEQRRIGEAIVRLARDLKPRLAANRARSKRLEDLPPTVRGDLEKVHRMVAQFRRLQHAAPIWHAVLANHKKKAPIRERELVERINHDLEARSLRMLEQLDEIAENIQLIEIEIYNGASQDIIWQNAHPDYVKLARQMKDDAQKASGEKVWDWGRAPAGDVDEHEIWEDELGSFKANLYNNCSSKDKYLALKLKRGK